jgi:hypothetical protein
MLWVLFFLVGYIIYNWFHHWIGFTILISILTLDLSYNCVVDLMPQCLQLKIYIVFTILGSFIIWLIISQDFHHTLCQLLFTFFAQYSVAQQIC